MTDHSPSQRIQTEHDIISLIRKQPAMMAVLRAVEALGLPDCWVGAGFVRNPVWDALHGRPWPPSYTDLDVVYFDPANTSPTQHGRIEEALRASHGDAPWSVRNQSRMHTRNGNPPYTDTADACRYWPETCTAIAVRRSGSEVELLAPFGITDLVSLIVRPTPAFAHKLDVYRSRIQQKRWNERWPKLRMRCMSGEFA